MSASRPALQNRLRLSGIVISTGLILEILTLYWTHPLAFVAFIVLGGSLVGVGVVLYLVAIVPR